TKMWTNGTFCSTPSPFHFFPCHTWLTALSGHLYFCASLQKGSHPIPHDAAVEASMRAIQ
ncbi:hypothetical protein GOODEAATRI_007941, partial [Goodea atripinnis]